MRNFHVNMNGWNDIGQHFTVFPDGVIVTGRSLNSDPACIKGANKGAVCVEILGNFDIGGDEMTVEQHDSVVSMFSTLCKHFNIPIDTDHILYHHWYDIFTGKRTNGSGNTKTCPGTNFFGGNTVEAATGNFIKKVLNHSLPDIVIDTTPTDLSDTTVDMGIHPIHHQTA